MSKYKCSCWLCMDGKEKKRIVKERAEKQEFADWWKEQYKEVPQAFQIRYAEALDKTADELAKQIDEAILRTLKPNE